ncbi:MAG TPA: CTP synthase [Candidatus Paceibacterota bacterium]|nr:CTP synthase [Candidatus Paceibacterota bacterium]
MKSHKYIFVLGGVMSGVGKGIATASIGTILESKGFKINLVKIDPYLNVDAGTMNPTEHGEVFVLDSGLETDQDMGNYERFLNKSLTNDDYITSGMVYKYVIDKERNLGYGGKCVEAIPHITDEILRRIERAAVMNHSDISVIEIGGTIGDYQNALFIEAARILKIRHPEDVLSILVSFLPVPGTLGEMKTKPTQNAIRQLNSYGLHADMIIARSALPLDKKRKEKIANATSVPVDNIISAPDIKSIYDVAINFEHDGIGDRLLILLRLSKKATMAGLTPWKHFVSKSKHTKQKVNIGIVGKYFDTGNFILSDAYLSVIEAIKFSAYHLGVNPDISWINAKNLETSLASVKALSKYDGIIVPGGFGETGIEGKIKAIQYCREHKIPYFGLCYGMQLAVIEFARHVMGLKDANTTEINPKTKNPVVHIMPEQEKKLLAQDYGGTMRLGAYPAKLKKGSIAEASYGTEKISERHRHRFEVNNAYVSEIEKAGMVFSGKSPDGHLCEIAELPRSAHPFFLGVQFHPEFKARPLAPHPLFTAFIKASLKKK